ncbi:MAG: hypothetical protein J6R57_02965 [Bacteroidales bacterium]|nr:hypothetical protein [Bacteroidales bacterium]
MEFKSQICTSVEQSKRLLELGLKKETADMYLTNMSKKGIAYTDDWQIGSIPYKDVMNFWEERGLQLGETSWEIIPAWSLHRLIEVSLNLSYYGVAYCYTAGSNMNVTYDEVIDMIEWAISKECFNKDYLEDKND